VVRIAQTAFSDWAQKLMAWKLATIARVANGWSMNTDTMGVYGNYYLKRAVVTQLGLGANLPEDAIYPINLFDSGRQPLDGANKYTIQFGKGAAPPADAFWSITLYDKDGFQVANSLNRFAVSCHSNTTAMARLISISRTRAQALIWKRTGRPHRRGRSISPCGSTRPDRKL
jgi:hypothetical protein